MIADRLCPNQWHLHDPVTFERETTNFRDFSFIPSHNFFFLSDRHFVHTESGVLEE